MSKKILHISYMFTMLGGLFPMLVNGPSDIRDLVEDRSQAANAIYLAIHGVYFFIFLINAKRLLPHIKIIALPTILTVFIFSSIIWSDAPFRTFVIAAFLALQILAIVVILKTITFEEFFDYLATACLIASLLCLIFIFFIPSYGKMTHVFPGAWQGIFIHKNVLGRFAVFSSTIFLVLILYRKSTLTWSGLFSSITLVFGCGSATAAIGFVICAATLLILSNRKWLLISAGFSASIITSAYLLIPNIIPKILAAFEKSETLTGRTTIWELAVESINKNPLFGYGMGGFWGTSEAAVLRAWSGWFVPHAHNGFLEIALQIGYIGLIAFTLIHLKAISDAIDIYFDKLSKKIKYKEWPLLFVIFSLIYGAGEANYLRPNSFIQLALYSIIGYAALMRKKARSQQKNIPEQPT
ncbi:O-antigen ligase family protein [Pseudomonas stutzeri]|nr:O-antigen ligase family protein [Stutzerimonas stutzeri]